MSEQQGREQGGCGKRQHGNDSPVRASLVSIGVSHASIGVSHASIGASHASMGVAATPCRQR
eukprot:78823-Chlamydomonas_euryale.AAC.9